MIYGTAFDEITESRHLTGTGSRKDLASPMTDQAAYNGKFYVLQNTPIGSVSSETRFAVVSAGIDQNNNPYVTVNGTTYFDLSGAKNALINDGLYGRGINSYPYAAKKNGFPDYKTLADLIGALRWTDPTIPYSIYTPPAAPTPGPIVAPPPVVSQPTPVQVVASIPVPAGFSVMPANWTPPNNAWPIYGYPPQMQPGSTLWNFSGATAFSSLLLGDPARNPVGLDSVKLSSGLYAYRYTDLGAITSSAGRTYELLQFDIYDLEAQKSFGTFFITTEGGGSGLLISDPLELASRIIVDVSTFGTAEAARFAAQKAGVSDQNIKLATEAGAALAVVIATAGAATVLTAPTEVAATAFPVAADAGSSVALLPATASMVAESAAGSTLLPASLSLITPIAVLPAAVPAASILASEQAVSLLSPAAEEAASVPTVAATTTETAGGSTLLTGAVTATEKAVATSALAIGTNALTAEIKKLTGQVPKPSGGYTPGVAPTVASSTPPPSNSALVYIIGGAIALLGLTKKS
jgi:hypothetical protein